LHRNGSSGDDLLMKIVLVCAIRDVYYSFTIQEIVAISVFAALNVGKKMKYHLFVMSITQDAHTYL
jgi:hypothetical protein